MLVGDDLERPGEFDDSIPDGLIRDDRAYDGPAVTAKLFGNTLATSGCRAVGAAQEDSGYTSEHFVRVSAGAIGDLAQLIVEEKLQIFADHVADPVKGFAQGDRDSIGHTIVTPSFADRTDGNESPTKILGILNYTIYNIKNQTFPSDKVPFCTYVSPIVVLKLQLTFLSKARYNIRMHQFTIIVAKYFIIFSILLAFWTFIELPRRQKKHFIIVGALAAILSLMLAKIGAHFYYDTRPFVAGHFTPYFSHGADNGFPSDHTLLAGFLAFVCFKYSKKFGSTLLVLALAIGLSRVHAGVHHLTDIIGSLVFAFIGTVLAFMLAKRLEKADTPQTKHTRVTDDEPTADTHR